MTCARPSIFAMALLCAATLAADAQDRSAPRVDTVYVLSSEKQLRLLEDKWSDAHIRGDTAVLFALWADDITVTVPGMPTMSKQDLIRFWRSGSARLLRHETSGVRVRTWHNTAVVEGMLRRQRNFNGRVQEDHWRFTKVYVRETDQWKVVGYHASLLP